MLSAPATGVVEVAWPAVMISVLSILRVASPTVICLKTVVVPPETVATSEEEKTTATVVVPTVTVWFCWLVVVLIRMVRVALAESAPPPTVAVAVPEAFKA